MISRYSGLLAVLGSVVLTAMSLPAAAADPVPTDHLLPGDVYGYFTIPSIPEFRKQWEDSLYGELTRDPQLEGFRQELQGKIKEISEKLEKETSVDLDSLLQLPSGELSAAFLRLPPNRETGKRDFAGLLVADFGDNEDTVDTLLGRAMAALEKNGAVRTTREVDDTRIVIYTRPEKEEGADDEDADAEEDPFQQFAWFVRGSRFVLSSNPAALEAVLARWDGEHDSTFSGDRVYSYIMERCRNGEAGGKSVAEWYANPFGLLQAGLQAGGEQAQQFALVGNFLPILGVTKMRAIGGTVLLGGEEQVASSRTLIYVDKPVTGLLNVFHWPAVEMAPPKWIPADVSAFSAINWDFAAAYRAISSLVNSFYGEGFVEQQLDNLANDPNGAGIHLKKDFLDNLTGRIHYFTLPPPEDSPEQMPVVAGLATADEKKMKSVVKTVTSSPGAKVETREFRGHTIYETDGFTPGAPSKMGVTVARGHLLFATDVKQLERVLLADTDTAGLIETPMYRQLADRFPAKTSALSFQYQDAQIRTLYNMLRDGKLDEEMESGVDFQKLPPFEAMKKYLPATASYVIPDEHGVLMISFSSKVKQD